MSFEAKYGGQCAACGERIHRGDMATYVSDELVHVDCESSGRAEHPAEVCVKCWLTNPCDCESDE